MTQDPKMTLLCRHPFGYGCEFCLRPAPAPSAPPAALTDGWLQSGSLLYRLTDERRPQNRDEISVTMANGSRKAEDCAARASEMLALLAAQPAEPARADRPKKDFLNGWREAIQQLPVSREDARADRQGVALSNREASTWILNLMGEYDFAIPARALVKIVSAISRASSSRADDGEFHQQVKKLLDSVSGDCYKGKDWEEAQVTKLRAILSRASSSRAEVEIPEGYALVPKEPTKAMREAFKFHYKEGSIWTDRLNAAFDAMLEAAAEAPNREGE